jgi:DNA adenine methylase
MSKSDRISAKPFLKWAGGKGQLLKQFEKFYPDQLKAGKIKHYYEPFVGGGAVFFDIAQKYAIERATLFDINEELVLCYQVIQRNVNELLDFLSQYEKSYLPLEKKDRKVFYYDIRDTFNNDRFDINRKKYSENWIPRAAQIIFLNKTCYNGLFRFNNSGAFNSPAGEYVRPTICDENNLKAVSSTLQSAEIRVSGFEEVMHAANPSSFIYFDPPLPPPEQYCQLYCL